MASAPARRRSGAARCSPPGALAAARSSPPDRAALALVAVRPVASGLEDAADGSLNALREDRKPGPVGEPLGRLTKRVEFQRVARGRRVSAETFTLQSRRREAAERGSHSSPRVGLTVTKSVGGAVERNRVRRRLKEALRAAQPLEAESDHDYVLMARREALRRQFRCARRRCPRCVPRRPARGD